MRLPIVGGPAEGVAVRSVTTPSTVCRIDLRGRFDRASEADWNEWLEHLVAKLWRIEGLPSRVVLDCSGLSAGLPLHRVVLWLLLADHLLGRIGISVAFTGLSDDLTDQVVRTSGSANLTILPDPANDVTYGTLANLPPMPSH